jgi:rhodanese-related sulfurtransferase
MGRSIQALQQRRFARQETLAMDTARSVSAPAPSLHVSELRERLLAFPPPTVVDVRRAAAFEGDPNVIPGALRRLPDTIETCGRELDAWRTVVVYCVHGHEVSQQAARALAAQGLDARFLEGGVAAWKDQGGRVVPATTPSRWVTRARPKIDRIACPWLVRRFIDPAAEFFYVPVSEVRAFAAANDATPFDIPEVAYSHDGDRCSFDAFLQRHDLTDPALAHLATIVRGADTGTLSLAPEASGLLALSLGLSAMFADDHAMLRAGMLVYDALYAWCRDARGETHGWNPAALRAAT